MNFTSLVQSIRQTHSALQQQAVSAVNRSLTIRNWLIGYYIVQFEQKGEDRAEYGNRLLETIASDIKKAGIKGLTAPELSRCRQFYFIYPEIFGTLSQKSFPQLSKIIGTLSHESKPAKIPGEAFLASEKLVNSLSFSHFVELIKIHDPLKRSYYELLTIRHTLSIRQLKREINTLSYERTALSKDKDLSLKKIAAHVQPDEPVQAIKDVYVFDFLGLADYNSIEEADLEKALLDHLQEFLIELGHGFCFESRQQKILIGDRYYFIDLVFYHRILKCHVLIDLKVDEFDHVNAGQLNTYLNYYKKEVSQPNDNPPVGILMVTNKNEALVEYATAGMDNKLFVSKYLVQLPSKEQLQQFVQNELKQL